MASGMSPDVGMSSETSSPRRTTSASRRCVFRSIIDLQAAINAYLAEHNIAVLSECVPALVAVTEQAEIRGAPAVI